MLKRITKGSILTIIGYILSPFSFWNDIIVNLPLAYGFGFLFSLISKELFLPFMIIGYWLTNILGIILMHKGITNILSKTEKKYTKKELLKDLIISILYTLLMALLFKFEILKLPHEYF